MQTVKFLPFLIHNCLKEIINKMRFTKYFLMTIFLAVSVSCSAAVKDNQIVSPNVSDSGTAINSSNEENSTAQNNAPDAVVKELYKLHDADKSPLYEKKNRATVEKFFSKNFVNLIWTSGDEPNLMNKLAIEGDPLYGTSGTGKVKNLSVGKAQINGDKATVTASFEKSEDGAKFEKNSAIYELVKDNSDWRISDIKIADFYSGSLIGLINNLKKTSEESKDSAPELTNIKPPFVGTRWFVTEPGVSGSGTPRYYLKINSENYMFCGFVQTNQASGEETKEEVALGKFKKVFDCNFKNDLGGNHRYKVEGNNIYELNAKGQIQKSEDCCKAGSDSEECECKGEFISGN